MTGNESVERSMRIEFIRVVVPSTHVVAGSWLSGPLAKGLQQHVFIERKKQGVICIELLPHRSVQ